MAWEIIRDGIVYVVWRRRTGDWGVSYHERAGERFIPRIRTGYASHKHAKEAAVALADKADPSPGWRERERDYARRVAESVERVTERYRHPYKPMPIKSGQK